MKKLCIVIALIFIGLLLFLMLSLPSLESADKKDEPIWTIGDLVDAVSPNPKTMTAEQTLTKTASIYRMMGMVDMIPFLSTDWGKGKICLPKEGLYSEEVLLILVRWIKANNIGPEWTVRVALIRSLQDAYPCHKK